MIKMHLEKSLGVLDIYTAFSYTAEYSYDAVREEPHLPLHYDAPFECDIDPDLAAATDSEIDYLVKTIDVVETLSKDCKEQYGRDLEHGLLFTADELHGIRQDRNFEQNKDFLIEHQMQQAQDTEARRMQILWHTKRFDPTFFENVSKAEKIKLRTYIKGVKTHSFRQFTGLQAPAPILFESTSGQEKSTTTLVDTVSISRQHKCSDISNLPAPSAFSNIISHSSRTATKTFTTVGKKAHEIKTQAGAPPNKTEQVGQIVDRLQGDGGAREEVL